MKRLVSILGGVAMAAILLISSTFPVRAAGPSFNKNDFHHPLDISNKYFPLKPGTTLIYNGTTDKTPTRDTFVVTRQTKTILGVKTRVIRDTAFESGVMVEKTDDWFAQDDAGNVWYFGEFTTEFNPDGSVNNHTGSWQAGVNGARAGIVMEANPKVGDTYPQEFAKGVAQDKATVLSLKQSICVPFGCFKHVLEIKDFSPLEPGVVEHKFFAPGVGEIRSVLVQGGAEESHLVKIK
jgi:hypothetical protein